jgi:predicted dehydrogenase
MAQTYEGAYDKQENFINPNIWHFTFDKGGGGVIADQGVHKFAFLNWLIGSEVDFAQAWGGKALNSPPNKGEDNAIIFLHYKSGAMAEASVTSTSVHPLTNRTEIHGTKGSMVEDHASEKPLQVFTNHPEAEKRGEYFYPQMEHGPFPKYYTIAARCEDTYFADCILNDKTPEFTPEQAKAAVAVVLLSYLSIKKGNQIARMDELRQIANNKQTKSILNGLEPFLQKNYGSMIWK